VKFISLNDKDNIVLDLPIKFCNSIDSLVKAYHVCVWADEKDYKQEIYGCHPFKEHIPENCHLSIGEKVLKSLT
ncbi:MAG: hypothetical protein ACR5KV_05885, partial [Wolbachia sp.]